MGEPLVSVVLVVTAAYVVYRIGRWLRSYQFLVVAGRVLTGAALDGRPRTDAGWFRPGTKALTRSGHATRYWHRPRLHRAVMNVWSLVFTTGLIWGLLAHTLATIILLAVVNAAGLARVAYGLVMRRRRRTWLLPVHLAAHELVGHPRAALASSWITVEVDGNAVKAATFKLPTGWPADDKDKKRLVEIASKKLGIEAPKPEWREGGPNPQLVLTRSEPPPELVTLKDVRAAIDSARAQELVWGLGKQGALIKTSLDNDSPHMGLSIGSGGGKSMTARALAAQRAYRGDLIIILDVKLISHQWARDLPNVVIARWPHEIHDILLWLGDEENGEVMRRNKVALSGADLEGNVHAVVGPRIFVICEELNATVKALRRYWGRLDGHGRSPALDALDFVCYCGRQVLVNLVYIGQRLSVKAVGGEGDARESIGVIAFCRYTPSNWKMLAGDHPMPAKSQHPGRLQLVATDVREVQGVKMTAVEARDLALAGTVALMPHNMPGARRVAGGTTALDSGPDEQVVFEKRPDLGRSGGGLVRLSQAAAGADDPVVSLGLAALRKASQRPGFPPRRGMDGLAALYDAVELALWEAERTP